MNPIANFQFKSRIFIQGNIYLKTGLHIGGNSTEMSIGGVDNIVVRDPLTNRPYIPGSSLRGKMRSLFEKCSGNMNIEVKLKGKEQPKYFDHVEKLVEIEFEDIEKDGIKAGPSVSYDSIPANLFGVAVDAQKKQDFPVPIPQRLIVRDAILENWKELENAKNTDMPFTEVKTEVVIDRITSQAIPRQIERVPAGAIFRFEFILNLYGKDEEKQDEYLNALFECMQLLQDDYLGGNGSRGYGKVQFDVKELAKKTVQNYRNRESAQKMAYQIPDSLKVSRETAVSPAA